MNRNRLPIAHPTAVLLTVVAASLGCVAIASATPTTKPHIFDQPTRTTYNAFLSHSLCRRGICTATEYADVTIKGHPNRSPGGGTVTFTDNDLICVATLDRSSLDTVASCTGFYFSARPPDSVTAAYSGTPSGYGDGHGASYAASSGWGRPLKRTQRTTGGA